MEIPIPLPGRYRVRRVLGSGGMATVYLADDAETGREVAVKVLKRDLVSAVAVERFLREIRLSHDLSHSRIVPVLDSGEADGLPFLVMPLVPGETLRERIDREGPLPVRDAARITAAVAEALEAAHAREVVHRDVKPGNILLHQDEVFLADFGIARALSRSVRERLTESGLSVGTAGYMSPEQASGERVIDKRSDVYSLACVSYEMLTGEPPFNGPSAQAVIAKQLSLPAPSVLVLRPRLAEAVDDVLMRALAKSPADRFATVREFADAFATASGARTTRLDHARRLARRQRVPIGLGMLAAVAIAFAGQSRVADRFGRLPTLDPADSTRYAVLRIDTRAEDGALATQVERAAFSALIRWTDLTVLDEASVREAFAAQPDGPAAPRTLARIARQLRSGRYVVGDLHRTGTTVRVRLRLIDGLRSDSTLAASEGIIGDDDPTSESTITALMDSLVLGRHAGGAHDGASRSLFARRAYAHGDSALHSLDLERADSAFLLATQLDPQFAAAHLGVALNRMWRGVDVARWRVPAEQAALNVGGLSKRQQEIAAAVAAFARADLADACGRWRALTVRQPRDTLAHFGAAHCLAADDIVLPDPRSASGWRFRTSYHEAIAHYDRAFRLSPVLLASFGDGAMATLRGLFRTSGSQLRSGRAPPPSSLRFAANMTWAGETLAFVPYPQRANEPHQYRDASAGNEAVRRQRLLVRQLASTWVASAPEDPNALLSLATALASLGDPSAPDTLARARRLARTSEERLRISGAELGLRLAFAIRDPDSVALRAVKRSADSLLTATAADRAAEPVLLASIAALTGRAELAVGFTRAPIWASEFGIPAQLRDGVPALLILSALGGPSDSLRRLEARVSDQILRAVPQSEQLVRRLQFLARAASMAFPDHAFVQLGRLADDGDPFVVLQASLARGDSAAVRRGLDELRRERSESAPETHSLDAVVPEAALWLALGDADAAARWLDPIFAVLPQMEPGPLSSPLRAASLGRALIIRARAAEQLGDKHTSERFRAGARILWSDADPFLRDQITASRFGH